MNTYKHVVLSRIKLGSVLFLHVSISILRDERISSYLSFPLFRDKKENITFEVATFGIANNSEMLSLLSEGCHFRGIVAFGTLRQVIIKTLLTGRHNIGDITFNCFVLFRCLFVKAGWITCSWQHMSADVDLLRILRTTIQYKEMFGSQKGDLLVRSWD